MVGRLCINEAKIIDANRCEAETKSLRNYQSGGGGGGGSSGGWICTKNWSFWSFENAKKKSRGGGGEEGLDVNKDLKLLCKIKVGGSGVMWCIRDVNQE